MIVYNTFAMLLISLFNANFIILARAFKSEGETQFSDGYSLQNSPFPHRAFLQQSNRESSMKIYSS